MCLLCSDDSNLVCMSFSRLSSTRNERMMGCYCMHRHYRSTKRKEGKTEQNIRREKKHNWDNNKGRKNIHYNKMRRTKRRTYLITSNDVRSWWRTTHMFVLKWRYNVIWLLNMFFIDCYLWDKNILSLVFSLIFYDRYSKKKSSEIHLPFLFKSICFLPLYMFRFF
jgi:hypothetical protein